MLTKGNYVNGQKVRELIGDHLTFYYKSGKIKAEGLFINENFEGEWKFYRESGQVIQVGHFKNNKKEGSWMRYDTNGDVEYNEYFTDGRLIRHK